MELKVRSIDTDLHRKHVKDLYERKESLELYILEHRKISGVYWALMCLDLLDALDDLPKEEIIQWVLSTFDDRTGGFGANVGLDPQLLSTLSAVQIFAIYDELDRLPKDKIVTYVQSLQNEDGSFQGDEWGEIDTRFSYAALLCMKILGQMDAIDVPHAVDFVLQCRNFDGGFGCIPGAESHAGQSALALTDTIDRIDEDQLGWWLCERQLDCGGLNGRPDKKEDVCYSWWVLSALDMLGKIHWIDGDKLRDFILECQSPEGGIANRPGDVPDVFHTFFGLAGLSLLGYPGLSKIDPSYALPARFVEQLKRTK